MYCRNCGEPMNDNQAICLKCGVKVGVGNSYCKNCGASMNPGQDICMQCGVASGSSFTTNTQYGNYDKITLAIICFFIGGFGIHNFLLGETKKGIFKIIMTCCCGIGYIFAIIDLVKLLTDTYVIDPEALV